jgi:hypothetical protein
MLKGGLPRVTTNRGKPDASDLGAAGFRRDRSRPDSAAKFVPPPSASIGPTEMSGNPMVRAIRSYFSDRWIAALTADRSIVRPLCINQKMHA